MALIKCNNCGRDISDKIDRCIHCGTPLNQGIIKPKRDKKSIIYIIIPLIPIIIGLIGYLIYNIFLAPKPEVWSRYITWEDNGILERETYAEYTFKKNGSFSYQGYNIHNKKDSGSYSGTYEKEGNIIKLTYKENGSEYGNILYISDNKLHEVSKKNQAYFVQGDDNHITINYQKRSLSYTEYNDIIDNHKDAIIVATSDTCYHCTKFAPEIKNVSHYFETPIYFYNILYNDYLDITGTPETIIIKDGQDIKHIIGYKEADNLLIDILNAGIE